MIAEFLQIADGGGSAVVGVVGADLEPIICRGWGISMQNEALSVLIALEESLYSALSKGRSISVTTSNMFTYRTIQVRGIIESFAEPTLSEQAQFDSLVKNFLVSASRAMVVSSEEVAGMLPPSLYRVVFSAEEYFDQTPGQKA